MLKIDVHGLNVANDNRVEPILSPDERCEWEFTRVIARRIITHNHNIHIRLDDISPQERANLLLDGKMDELSLYLRIEDRKPPANSTEFPKAGYELRTPGGNHPYDILFAEMIRKWFGLIPDWEDYASTRKPLLMPPRDSNLVRPARLEIAFQFFQAPDWDYWCAPVMLRTIANHISRAINEFDDRFNEVKLNGLPDDLSEKRKSMMDMLPPEEDEILADARPKGKLKVLTKGKKD